MVLHSETEQISAIPISATPASPSRFGRFQAFPTRPVILKIRWRRVKKSVILKCLEALKPILSTNQTQVVFIYQDTVKQHEELSDMRIAKSKHAIIFFFFS